MARQRVKRQSTAAARERLTVGSVISADRTTIGFRRLGGGPGVVLLHGGMESAQSHLQLAEALADTFTVYLPDRRGRGLSGPFGQDYSIRRDVEDLDALLTATGAHQVFGVSTGGLICLQAALTLPAIRKAVVCDPPLSVNGSVPIAWLARYDRQMAQGNVAAALITGMKGARFGPPLFNALPDWPLALLTKMMMSREEKRSRSDSVTWRALAPTLHYDGQLILEMAEQLESFRALRAEVLLLCGSESPAYHKVALASLERVLPRVERLELPRLTHGGSGNTDRGGKPERVARELRRFFASP